MMRPLPAKTLLLSILFTASAFQAALPQAVPQAKLRTMPDNQLLNAAREITVPVMTADSGTAVFVSDKVSQTRADKNILTDNFKVYPVPAISELTVSGIENVSLLEVFDVTGNRIISEKCDGIEIKTMNISHLARGIYFIRITTPLGAVMKRFVKE